MYVSTYSYYLSCNILVVNNDLACPSKYRTKFVSDDWMIEQGFMEDPAIAVGSKLWFVN